MDEEEYILAGLATKADGAARAPLAIIWARDPAAAAAFGAAWLADQAPAGEGWAGHTLRVARLAELRQPAPAGPLPQ